jgi:hypothetical protein
MKRLAKLEKLQKELLGYFIKKALSKAFLFF